MQRLGLGGPTHSLTIDVEQADKDFLEGRFARASQAPRESRWATWQASAHCEDMCGRQTHRLIWEHLPLSQLFDTVLMNLSHTWPQFDHEGAYCALPVRDPAECCAVLPSNSEGSVWQRNV